MSRTFTWLVIAIGLGLSPGIAAQEDQPMPWPGEELAGGDTTVSDQKHTAFGRALNNLDPRHWATMRTGKRLFESPWRVPTSEQSSAPRQGLGPLYNATACIDCHFRDGRGGPPVGLTTQPSPPPWIVRWQQASGESDPRYGSQLNDRSSGLQPEGILTVHVETVSSRSISGTEHHLQTLRPAISRLTRGLLHPETRASLRIPPTLVGLGLLEAVSAEDLEKLADPDDLDGDGISGRLQRIPSASGPQIGRFGWKAAQPSLEAQIAHAFYEDMGITSNLHPKPNCPTGDTQCQHLAGNHIELTDTQLQRVTQYLQLLAPPARRDWTHPQVLRGRNVFDDIGCTECHRPQLTTAQNSNTLPELATQTIWPYTDLLLHDMGPELAAGGPEHGASATEWRTPPLWGLGLLEQVNGHLYLLHDGRARSFTDAILWHGGEAERVRDHFIQLTSQDRKAMLLFLDSL